MSDSPHLPASPSLEQLQKQAKELLRQHRAGQDAAIERFRAASPRPGGSSEPRKTMLADAQFVIAREHGFESWAKLKHYIEEIRPAGLEQYEQLAKEVAAAYMSADTKAIRELNRNYGTEFGADFHDPVRMHQRLTTWYASESRAPDLALADARRIVANSYGFESWAEFARSVAQGPADPRSAPLFMSPAPPFYRIDWMENRLSANGPQSEKDWERIFAVVKEHRIEKVEAGGISDAAMKRLAGLDHITHLNIAGSKELTDEGARYLAHMPQLRELEIGGWQTPITDGAFEALRHLTELSRFESTWTQGISDAGVANLAFCDHLEKVNLMGTPAGDGLIQALAGKAELRRLNTGRGVTDAGIRLLHRIPAFRTWLGGEIRYGLAGADTQPNHLMIDGPFTDAGLAGLAGLDGVFGLGFFWHCPAFTSAGLKALRHLPNLGFLACQDEHCNDKAMRQIAALPRLKMLMGQGTVASDEGFAALSRSQTIEYIWGRECPNLTGRGFAALAAMPALRGIAVSCKNVDDGSLAALPRFLALRELIPMDVSDAGFRHVGRCENLERLWCMYCRDTGDAATEHLAGLTQLKMYYAGMTQITDRSLEILGRIGSLEKIEFWECQGITDRGVAHLASLPRLREVEVYGSPGVSRSVMGLFPAHVRVRYSG
jgi:hypothetical protein